jgi:hypothetical protein
MRLRRRETRPTAAWRWMAIVGSALVATGCLDNTAPGNDREAALEPPAAPAPMATAGAAIEGVARGSLMPQIMTDADRSALPEMGSTCRFRMTRVGFPVAVYGSSAVIKLNDLLVTLEAAGEGRYGADGVEVTIRPLEDRSPDGPFASELVLWLPGAPHERGYHGYSNC